MGLFKKIFGKEEKNTENQDSKSTKSNAFHALKVLAVDRLTSDSVQISFEIPSDLKSVFEFIPGQYLNISTSIGGNEIRRSYSICSGPNEPLAVAVKQVSGGVFSSWVNQSLKAGDVLEVAAPVGNFTLNESYKKIVAIAAGSGITPILSMAKALNSDAEMHLFYGNRTEDSILFRQQLTQLDRVKPNLYLSGETKAGFHAGRIDKQAVSQLIKDNLELLKSDAFFLCGPEEMIFEAVDVLKMFGVSKEKIHFELFTTPVLFVSEPEKTTASDFKGTSQVTVTLDDEVIELKLKSDGKTILDAITNEGFDAPYSCRGGVCCTCRAKVIEGSVRMTLNYSLTDQEVKDGYILTCQAHPTSEVLKITYDA